MAYTKPTPADLKRRYPAFANVSDDDAQFWLTDAERFVDESWMESDYAPALEAVAAHNMLRVNVAGLTVSKIAGLAAKGITQFKSGSFSAQLSDQAVARIVAGGWASTPYGDDYLALLRRNKTGIGVTGPGVVPAPCRYNDGLIGYCR